MDLIIECNDIFKEYSKGKDAKKVLKGLDFTMEVLKNTLFSVYF